MSPPVKPDAGWNLLGLGIIVLAGFGVFYGGIFGFLSSGRTGDPGMCISLSLILGLVGFVISAAAHSRRVDEIRKIELPAWEKAVQRWDRLYYCFRDDCIFDPQSGESVTAGNITDIINK